MKEILKKLVVGKNLTRLEAYAMFSHFFEAPREQQAAILAALRAKNESVEEILGARDFFLTQSNSVKCPFDVVEIVGTGGDGIGTFNISTAANLVLASCGVPVVKHGGRSSTSLSGSMDVLECLGLRSCNNTAEVSENLRKYHYAYLLGPLFNTALKQLGGLRKILGFPTLGNILGPLLNPAKPSCQVIGVYRRDLVRSIAQVLKEIGSLHSLVVHSDDGMDELSLSAYTHIAEVKNGKIQEYSITPMDVGLTMANLSDVIGSRPENNALIIRDLFSGALIGPKLDIVLFNTAAGLYVAGKVQNLREGVEISRNAIESGKALGLLNQLQSGGVYE